MGTVQECYSAVGIIHSLWHPLPEAFDDYIANPKPNGYQALHTAVMCLGTTPLEIQIRTREMHHVAEYGVAAHWRYKEGGKKDIQFEERVAWLRQLIEWHRELSGAEEFLESVKTDIFIDQVFVYTPKGEIKDLPRGATPLDFAYRVHTDLGHRCVGAKVNGKLVPLSYELKNGDVVEIISAKGSRGPEPGLAQSQPGLRADLARPGQDKAVVQQAGADGEHRARPADAGQGAAAARHQDGAPGPRRAVQLQLAGRLPGGGRRRQRHLEPDRHEAGRPGGEVDRGYRSSPRRPPPRRCSVLGVGDLVTNIAQCCHPVPGDKIIGYITRSRGVTIHRQDCHNVINEDERERLIPVEWGQSDVLYPVNIQLQAWDRVGLMRDVTTLVAEERVNIASVNLANGDGHTVTMYLTLETKGLAQLSQILKKIDGVRGVISVSRVGGDGIKPSGAPPPATPIRSDDSATAKK